MTKTICRQKFFSVQCEELRFVLIIRSLHKHWGFENGTFHKLSRLTNMNVYKIKSYQNINECCLEKIIANCVIIRLLIDIVIKQ